MKSFQELIDVSNGFDLGFVLERAELPHEHSLKLSNHYNPWSLQEHEATIVYETVIHNSLKVGFEIATAFGISSVVMGQALYNTGGRLVTVDAYVEEHFNGSANYSVETRFVKTKEDSDGFKMANALIKHLSLEDTVTTEIGWSPDDVPSIIEKNFGNTKLDFAFIDGGHSFEQIHADVNVVLPYLSEDSIIIFHDYGASSPQTTQLLDVEFTQFKRYSTHFDLAMYARGNKTLI